MNTNVKTSIICPEYIDKSEYIHSLNIYIV